MKSSTFGPGHTLDGLMLGRLQWWTKVLRQICICSPFERYSLLSPLSTPHTTLTRAFVDCNTVSTFACSSSEQSNGRSGTRLRTESETRERRYGHVRLASFARVRLLRHALPISLLILRKKPTVLQSSVFAIAPTIQHCLGCRRPNRKGHLLKDGTALWSHYCRKDFCLWM